MKKLLIFCLSLAVNQLGFAQCSVSVGPDITQCNGNPITITAVSTGTASEDSLRIVYDATQGVSGLTGASEVYFHSGVQTVPFGGWEFTVGNWGANDGLGQMTSLGNNLWQITIHIDNYYDYPGGTSVNGLWMVFRNGDATLTGKNDNDEDVFLYTSNGYTCDFGGVTGTDIPGTAGSYLWGNGATTQSITATQTGTFSVTFTDGTGCASTDEVYVEFGTGSIVVNLGPDTSLCDGQIITLDAGAGFASYEWSTAETSQTLEVGLPGDYAVTVTDQFGCTGIDLIHIETGVTPEADFSYAAVTGTTIEFVSTGSGADIIYWDFDGDGNVDETVNAGVPVQYDFGAESVFGVRMIAENGCGADTATQNVLVQDVGIEELKSEIGFSVYPNPTTDDITFSVSNTLVTVSGIEILDLQGRRVMHIPATQNTHHISLNKLPAGLYFLQIATSKGIISERILKL